MRLEESDARGRLQAADHGVLCTVHPIRGVDAVPAVFALDDLGLTSCLGVPVDKVKPKSSPHLQRQKNLDGDPRATFLVEHWDPNDWLKLWWVRAELKAVVSPESQLVERLTERLTGRYHQYTNRPFHHVLVFEIDRVTGWTADG